MIFVCRLPPLDLFAGDPLLHFPKLIFICFSLFPPIRFWARQHGYYIHLVIERGEGLMFKFVLLCNVWNQVY
jgi:hypothetical protein